MFMSGRSRNRSDNKRDCNKRPKWVPRQRAAVATACVANELVAMEHQLRGELDAARELKRDGGDRPDSKDDCSSPVDPDIFDAICRPVHMDSIPILKKTTTPWLWWAGSSALLAGGLLLRSKALCSIAAITCPISVSLLGRAVCKFVDVTVGDAPVPPPVVDYNGEVDFARSGLHYPTYAANAASPIARIVRMLGSVGLSLHHMAAVSRSVEIGRHTIRSDIDLESGADRRLITHESVKMSKRKAKLISLATVHRYTGVAYISLASKLAYDNVLSQAVQKGVLTTEQSAVRWGNSISSLNLPSDILALCSIGSSTIAKDVCRNYSIRLEFEDGKDFWTDPIALHCGALAIGSVMLLCHIKPHRTMLRFAYGLLKHVIECAFRSL